MAGPYFLATERFDASDKAWRKYIDWAHIPGLTEIVSLDVLLCPSLIKELQPEDWNHNVHEDYCCHYFADLEYLIQRVSSFPRRNILAVYRNPEAPTVINPSQGNFQLVGHDLTDETGISALTNCGGFTDVFGNDELNGFGLIEDFDKASTVRCLLAEKHSEEGHAQCKLHALWRLDEG
ncbi:MAG: hypothetical protein JWO08_4183 [Verrucomicrobiaceae bacterium]|nr:hypothetical protein [Verrucomicrobiaceae bacterium]